MLKLLDHPLAQHVLTRLRDERTQPSEFRLLSYHLGLLLALDATFDLKVEAATICTPLEEHEGRMLAEPLLLIPILRAGIGLVQPFTDLFPDVSVGYIGLERNEQTAVARRYYAKLPNPTGRKAFVLDPMLATGGSAVQAIDLLRRNGVQTFRLVCVVAAPEGVQAVEEAEPGTEIYAAALDRELNERKYILPGLGDYGDRLYGT